MTEIDFPALHRIESEQSVIGGLLLNAGAWDDISDIVVESDFFELAHRLIYRRIGLLLADRKGVDIVTVADALESAGETEQTGGLAYLGELAGNTPSTANIRHYAQSVADCRLLRDLLASSNEIADLARTNSGEPAAARIDKAQAMLLAIAERKADQSEPEAIGAFLADVVEDVQARYDRDGEIAGLTTGFADVDELTCGLQNGDLIIVAGRPSMGKTAIAINIAEHVAMGGGTSLVFSLEMSRKHLAERCIASIGGVNSKAMRAGKMSDQDFSGMSAALGKLCDAKLIIDERPALSIAQMWSRARRVKRKHGLTLIVVDYIQLMRGEGNNRNEEVSSITRGLKLMARDLDVPLIALSQLSRKVEERADKRPMMSDLRDSGAIEQDADVIAMMYRDEYYNHDSAYKGMAEMIFCKQRMGEVGTVSLLFQGEFSRFKTLDKSAYYAAKEVADTKPTRRVRKGMDE